MDAENNETNEPTEPTEPTETTEEQLTEPTEPSTEEEAPEGEESSEDGADPEEGGEEKEASEENADTKVSAKKRQRPNGYQRYQTKIEKLEREREILLSQLAGSRPQGPAAPAAPDKPRTPEEQLLDLVDQRADMKARALFAARDQEAAQRQLTEKWDQQLTEDEDSFQVRRFIGNLPRAQVDAALKEALLTSEYAPKIISLLLKNPVELSRLDALPPAQAAREIGRLEAKFAAGATPVEPKPKSAIRPPVPPTTVGKAGTSTRNLDDLSISDYKRAYRSGRR